ncbi:rRNA-processing protein and EBNA1-binding protein ebp2 [Hanseniaspora osmophila]
MAKGSKLKQMLKDHKEVEKYNKEEQKRQQKAAKQLEEQSDAPVIVGKEDLIQAEEHEAARKAEAEKAASSTQSEEYKSKALSKKEKRQLKKQQKKDQEEQVKDEIVVEEEDENDEDEDEDYKQPEIDVERLARSDDDLSDSDEDEDDDEEEEDDDDDEEEQEQEDDEEQDVPLSDVEFDSDADIVPYQKVTINNKKALLSSLERIVLPWEKHSFQEHQSVTSGKSTEESIKDIYNDTERELAFYKQSLEAVLEAKEKLYNLKVPFKRPLDYFAEMVKTDDHMDKLKQKMVQEASEKKAIEDARRQRNLKKFGKQVQVATLQQRQKEKRETLDKIKTLRKKRPAGEMGGAGSGKGDSGDFNVAVEEAVFDNKRGKPQVSKKRAAKDAKYGFGGMKRFKRKNDAESSADMGGFSHKKMKGNNSRPGKSKRTRRN